MRRRLAIINGGRYTSFILEALNPAEWEITEWEIIPIVGDYDLVLFFLEGLLDIPTFRSLKRQFIKYTNKYPCKWIMLTPPDSLDIRKSGIMKHHHRCILDACRFGFHFKKRFHVWSSFPMTSVLCNNTCRQSKGCYLHDPKNWNTVDPEPLENRHIELLKAYDNINVIPLDFIRHIIELSIIEDR